MFLADHKRERCANVETTFFPTHAAGLKKIVADRILAHAIPQMDTAYFEADLKSMRDALSVIDEEWERYNRRSEGRSSKSPRDARDHRTFTESGFAIER